MPSCVLWRLAERGVACLCSITSWPRRRCSSFAVRQLGCGCGIVVPASHNAGAYNGVKCYGPDGCQMTDEPAARRRLPRSRESRISSRRKRALEDFLAEGGVEFIAPELWERYYETVLGERLAAVPSDNLNLLYTPLCGTGNKPVRTVLGRIGVNARCRSRTGKAGRRFQDLRISEPGDGRRAERELQDRARDAPGPHSRHGPGLRPRGRGRPGGRQLPQA